MKILLSCLLLCLSLGLSAQDESSIHVKTNAKQFTVTLAANPTTGYQWSAVKFDKKLFTLSQSHFQRPQTQLMGAGGHMVFTFTINQVKKYPPYSDIVFLYARSWEPKSGNTKKVRINFN